MRKIKKKAFPVAAWQLGAGTEKEAELIAKGLIVKKNDGTYAVFSKEATQGEGEIAEAGDYFKIGDGGYPYPNKKDWFEERHVKTEDGAYVQKTSVIEGWEKGEEASEAIQHVIDKGLLEIHEETPEYYYKAQLWGTTLTAPVDAVIAIYKVEKEDGKIVDVDFNLITRKAFNETYEYVD